MQRLGVLEEMGIELGSNSMDEVMRRLSRGGSGGDVAIGMDEVRTAAEQGAIERLLVEELFFKENAKSLQGIILSCIRAGGTVSIIPKGSEAGQRLRGLGGVAALLRFEFFLKGN